MLVTIRQIKANFENLFEVSLDGKILFHAKAPWLKASLPFKAENLRELTFSDITGETLYTTCYKFIDNMVEEAIPFKYLITKEQRFGQYEIVGKNGSEGTFYTIQNGMFDSKFCIQHMGKVFLGYSLDKGRNNYVSIYDDEKQIAQITKPLTVMDNLDVYFLHIIDEYRSIIPILSFFTVYYDYRKYNNSGEITKKSVEISVSYSYGLNNNKYNPDWIAQEFGQQVSDELKQSLENLTEQGKVQAKKVVSIVGIVFLILILLVIILFIIIMSLL